MIARPEREAAAASAFRPVLQLVSGRTIGFIASFGIPVVLVRIFDQRDFGTYKQFFLIAATLYGIGQLGMAESLFYFLPRDPEGAARYSTNAAIALFAGGLGCLTALWLAGDQIAHWLSNADLGRYALLLGLYLLFLLLSALLEIVMISRRRYSWASGAYAALDLLRAVFLVVPSLVFRELEWLLAGAVAFAALRCALTLWYLWSEFGTALRPDGGLFRQQLAYAVPFQLSGIVETVQLNLHQYVVAYRFDAAMFAVYSVGCLQIPMVEVVFSSVVNVMMVRMAEELRDGQPANAVAVWHDSMRKMALLFLPLLVLLVVAARPVIAFLFTDQYRDSVPVFMASCLMLMFPVLAVEGVLRVYAQTRFLFALNLIRLAVTIGSIWWLIAEFGLVGAVLATVLAGAVTRVIGVARIGQLTHLSPTRVLPWRDLGAILGAAVLAGIPAAAIDAVQLAPLASLVAMGLVYGLGYLVAVWALGVLTPGERQAVRTALQQWGMIRAPRPAAEVSACVESRE